MNFKTLDFSTFAEVFSFMSLKVFPHGHYMNNRKLFSFSNYRLNLDVTWSETGNRYMLKLFRDYL